MQAQAPPVSTRDGHSGGRPIHVLHGRVCACQRGVWIHGPMPNLHPLSSLVSLSSGLQGLGNIGSLRTNLGTNLGSLKATSTERFGTLGGFWRRDKDKASSSAGLDEDKGLPDLVRVESPSSNDAAAEGSAQPAATATATTAPAGGAKEVWCCVRYVYAQRQQSNVMSAGGGVVGVGTTAHGRGLRRDEKQVCGAPGLNPDPPPPHPPLEWSQC